jgi:hypothetical protein
VNGADGAAGVLSAGGVIAFASGIAGMAGFVSGGVGAVGKRGSTVGIAGVLAGGAKLGLGMPPAAVRTPSVVFPAGMSKFGGGRSTPLAGRTLLSITGRLAVLSGGWAVVVIPAPRPAPAGRITVGWG